MIGQTVENYKVVEVLGEGGMGIVYKAFDLQLERYIALKILNNRALNNPHFIARFKREAKNQAKLNHHNIVPVYGFTEGFNTLGIAMEYVEGETLEHLIQRKKALNVKDSLIILKQILTGAGYAHKKGFVHRDLKPSNIILNNEGTAKIMDFGISKSINEANGITKTGTKIGTILYMSPEQIKAQEPTAQSDIYSIGITFYEMLTGLTPFDVGTEFEIMEAHLKKNPPKLASKEKDIPSEVDKIIGKALNKTLAKRYLTAEEFLDDINSLYTKLETEAFTPPKIGKNKSKPSGNKKRIGEKIRFYLFAFIFLIIISAIVYFAYYSVSQFWKSSTPVRAVTKGMNFKHNSLTINSNWQKIKTPLENSLNSIAFLNDSVGFACGFDNTIIKTDDAGYSWSVVDTSGDLDLFNILFVTPKKGFIIGENGTILSTSDSGKSWEKLPLNITETLFDIEFLEDKTTGFIIGGKGTILTTENGGNNWQKISSPINELFYSISFADDENGFIVGWDGDIIKTSDRGKTWKKFNKLSDKYLRDIKFINSKTGIITGGGGEIFRTDDGGNTWNSVASHTISGLYSVKFLNDKNGFILGSKGEILTTNDAGATWNKTSSGNFISLTDISFTKNNLVIAGYNGTILINNK